MGNLEEKYVNARINYCAAELGVEPAVIVELFLSALWKRALEEGMSDTTRGLIQGYVENVSDNSSDIKHLFSKLGIEDYTVRIRGNNVIHISEGPTELIKQWDMVISVVPGTISISIPYLSNNMRHRVNQIIIPESVETIKPESFEWMSIKELIFPSKITEIPYSVCCGCGELEKVILPEGITKIDDSAFRFCRSLKDINIPLTVTSIGHLAFEGCDSLSDETKRRIEEIGGEEVFGKKSTKEGKEGDED